MNTLEISPQLLQDFSGEASFDAIMALDGKVFRAVEDRKTLRFTAGDHAYFIKMHHGVGWREIFKNLLQGRLPVLGAINEYRAIKRLTELGVETMKPMGYGCRGLNPAKRESFVITEELPATVTLEEYTLDWSNTPPPVALKRALICRIAETARTLHRNGINHRDFYVCHFNIQTETALSGPLHLYLMDLHRAQIRPKTPHRWILKDIAGICFSSRDLGLTQRDLFRFIKIYTGQPLRRALDSERGFWAAVEQKADKLYRKHQIALQRHGLQRVI